MNIPEDFKFKTSPFKHQIEGIEYGLNHDKWLLADQMGLGKSKQVINIADIREVKHCLIICCVNGLKWNWLNEVHKHSQEKGYILGQYQSKAGIVIKGNPQRLEDLDHIDKLPRFIITNIETLQYRVPTGEKVEKVIKGRIKLVDKYRYPITEKLQSLCDLGQIDMIAVDEFHLVKNDNTEQAKQLLKIHSPIQIAITGTPVENSPLDVYMSLRWLGYYEGSFMKFKYRYCTLGGYEGKEVLGYKHLDEITCILDKMMLRRLKKDTLDLPEKIFVDEYIEMSSKQMMIYKGEKRELVKNIDKIKKSANPLTEFLRARQATGYTGILSNTIKVSAKFDRLYEIVRDAAKDNRKVVIFSNWTQIVNPAYERLSRKFKGVMIVGETNEEDRIKNKDQFQNNPEIEFIIGTIGAMGYGYDLFSGSIVIFLDEPSNTEKKNQAIDRCHRIGQNNNITIYTFMCRGTVDERIHHLVETRGEISNILIDENLKIDKTALINYLLS